MSDAHVLPSTDVVVVGAGASGAAITWRLATSGVNVVCLEQGGWVAPESAPTLDVGWEKSRQRSHHPNPNVRKLPADYPVPDEQSDISPMMYNAVGGSTIHWGAHFPRLRPSDFRVRTLDGVGDDWPIDYDDLDPYFALNDHMMGVSGLAGDPGNPTRTERGYDPLPLGRGGELLADAYERLGWHWWPADAAILTADRGDRSACNLCGPCDLGCPRRARASTDLTYWPEALTAGAQLRTDARVLRVTEARGRATGVDYLDADGRLNHQPAGTVVLAANGVGSARLMLLSGDGHDGLANGSGLVGRRLMFHPTAMVTGVFDEPLEGFKGPFATSLVSQEFYETDLARGFVRGYQAQTIRSDGPLGTAMGGYTLPVPWGRRHHDEFARQFGHTANITVTAEDLPDPENRVVLSDTVVDSSGIPAPELRYRVDANARKILDFGIERNSEVLREAGARDILVNPLIRSAGFHLLGTARMGEDPATSVVDPECRAHDVPNLLVVDGSVFVTVGATNPTSTLQAIALRAADAFTGKLLNRGEATVVPQQA